MLGPLPLGFAGGPGGFAPGGGGPPKPGGPPAGGGPLEGKFGAVTFGGKGGIPGGP